MDTTDRINAALERCEQDIWGAVAASAIDANPEDLRAVAAWHERQAAGYRALAQQVNKSAANAA